MGLGPATVELLRQLKITGGLAGISDVMELGSQDYHCPHDNLIRALFNAFGTGEPPSNVFGATLERQKPARFLYEGIGWRYHCVDVDGREGTIIMDLNLDSVPPDHRARYGFVTNHGTTEHLVNQSNAFQVMHDFTRPGGLMLHMVPFMGFVDHGFFSYHPNLFQALARYNSYETIGLWIGLNAYVPQFVPWDISILETLALTPRSTLYFVAALRKMQDAPFCIPFQGVYETMIPDHAFGRYAMSVDAELMDANRVRRLIRNGAIKEAWQSPPAAPPTVAASRPQLRQTPGAELLREIAFRVRRRLFSGWR